MKQLITIILSVIVATVGLFATNANDLIKKELLGSSYSGGVTTLDWVIRFDSNNSTLQDKPIEIIDVFNGVQTYLPPTEAHPNGWSVTQDPSGFTWQSDSAFGYSKPLPTNVIKIKNDGNKDGFAPIPYTALNGDKRFYYLNHTLQPTDTLFGCIGECSSSTWPMKLPDGDPSSSDTSGTSGAPETVLFNRKLYYPVTRANDSGIGCYDLESDSECGYMQLSTLGRTGNVISTIDGLTKVGNALYILDSGGTAYKVTLSSSGAMSLAGSHTFTAVDGMTADKVSLWIGKPFKGEAYGIGSEVVGSKVYFSKGTDTKLNRRMACLDTSTMGQCSGWPGVIYAPSTHRYGLNEFVYYNASMTPIAICLSAAPDSMPEFQINNKQCFNLNTGVSVEPPVLPFLAPSDTDYGIGFEATVGTKTYFPDSFNNNVKCYDWATNSSCGTFVEPSALTYGVVPDDEGCLWVLGHNNYLWSIDTGNGACHHDTLSMEDTYDASNNWCASENVNWHYTAFEVTGITAGEFSDLNVTFYDANGNAILTQSIPTNGSAFSVDLGASPFTANAPIHYKIEGTRTGTSNPEVAPPVVTIGVDGPPREFCFKTQVPCPVTGDIVNNAYLKYQDTAQFIDTDEVMTQGDMVCHEEIPSSGQCLSAEPILQCTPVGWTVELGSFAPTGYNASNTQMQVLAPSGATVTKWGNTWYLNGVNPGDTVQLSMQGVQSGAGSLEGDDLCCDGESNITIPQDQSCEVEQPHVYVRKLYDEVSHLFTIRVVMMSTHYAPQVVSVTDTIPAGVTITGIDPSSASEWSCGNNFPVTGPASLNCVYIGVMPVSGAKYLKLTSTIDNSQMPAENCVDSGVLGTDGAPLDTIGMTHFCVPIPHQDNNDTNTSDDQNDTECADGSPCPQGQMCHDGLCVDQPSLPSCSAPMILASKQFVDCNANHTSCTFTLTLTNTDTVNPYSGNVFVHDETSQPGVGTVPVQITSISPAGLCPTTPTTAPFMCVTPMSFAPGETKTYTITINPYGAGGFVPGSFDTQSENCFGAFPTPNIPSGNYTNDGFDNAMFEAGYNPEGNPPPCMEFLNGNCTRYTDNSDANNSDDQNNTECTVDGAPCGENMICHMGECIDNPPIPSCDNGGCGYSCEICQANQICQAGACIVATEGTLCDDGNASTVNDTIIGGSCVGQPIACQSDAECGEHEMCINGTCIEPTLVVPHQNTTAKPKLTLKKYAPKICKAGERCTFRLKITNRGKKRYSGPLSIKERPREFVGRLIGTSPKSWRCRTKRKGYLCSNPKVTLDPGASTTVRLSVRIPQRAKGYLHNCAKLDPLKSGRSRIMAIQTVLKAKGFDPNGIDGGMGKGTKRALNAYMKSRNLSGKKGRAKAMQELYESFPHAVSKNSCVKVKIKRAKCREDEKLVGDICKPRCKKGQHWTGKQCVVCPRGSQWESRRKVCVKTNRHEITVKPHGKQCPKGYVYYNRKCTKIGEKEEKKCGFMQERDPHTGECRSKVDLGTVINVIRVIQGVRGGSGGGTPDLPAHP